MRLMHVKKPGNPDGLPGFFRHSSFKTAGLKLPGTPETAAFDAEQGDFPQAPFVAVREILISCAKNLLFWCDGFLCRRA